MLKTILVPVDFSENSVRALKALSIKAQVGDTVQNLRHQYLPAVLNLMVYKLNMSPERFEKISRKNAKGFEKFMEEELPEYMNQIEPILIWNDMPDVAHHIMDNGGRRQSGGDGL